MTSTSTEVMTSIYDQEMTSIEYQNKYPVSNFIYCCIVIFPLFLFCHCFAGIPEMGIAEAVIDSVSSTSLGLQTCFSYWHCFFNYENCHIKESGK